MRKNLFCLFVLGLSSSLNAQPKTETRNLIIITLDGFRWQEVFQGADSSLLENSKYILNTDSVKQFQGNSATARREKLLPFFWNTISAKGQLYGNRGTSNYMNCSNPYWFSYPGYHEMLVGAVDRNVCSNLKIQNPNSTVLEFLNRQDNFKNSIAVFSTWDIFPYILRESSSHIPVNAGVELVTWKPFLSTVEWKINEEQLRTGKRTDSITFHLAMEHLQNRRPKVLYIALDEPDHYAHKDRYDQYLSAAHHSDAWFERLWNWVQSDPEYKDHTTFLITTDHGRGQTSKSWRHHGRFTKGSDQIWMAVIGPDTPPTGEMKTPGQLYQQQIAATIAAFLGLNYTNDFPVASFIETLIKYPDFVAKKSALETSAVLTPISIKE